MPETEQLAIPYPATTDGPLGPQQMQAMAESVEALIVADRSSAADLRTRTAPALSEDFPSDPAEGQIAYLSLPAAGAYPVVWVMRWNDSLGLWQAVGGMPAAARNDDLGTRAAGAANYDDLSGTAVGPQVTIPSQYTGTVKIRLEARIQVAGSPGGIGRASVKVGSGTPDDANAVTDDGDANNSTSVRTTGAIDVVGGDVLTMKYSRNTTGTTSISKRYLEVYPLTAEAV